MRKSSKDPGWRLSWNNGEQRGGGGGQAGGQYLGGDGTGETPRKRAGGKPQIISGRWERHRQRRAASFLPDLDPAEILGQREGRGDLSPLSWPLMSISLFEQMPIIGEPSRN